MTALPADLLDRARKVHDSQADCAFAEIELDDPLADQYRIDCECAIQAIARFAQEYADERLEAAAQQEHEATDRRNEFLWSSNELLQKNNADLRAENARLREGLLKQDREHPNGCAAWTRECEAKLAAAERERELLRKESQRRLTQIIDLEQRENRLREALERIVGISTLPIDHIRPIEHSCCAVAEATLKIGGAALAGEDEGEK